MRIRLSKSLVWSSLMVCAVVLGFAGVTPLYAKEKVEICHFQPGQGSWKLLSVGQSAVDAHLRNHDDALPGETTSQTRTALDANCRAVTAACPCGDAQALNEQFEALPFGASIGCILNQQEGFVFFRRFDTADNAAPNLALSARFFGPPFDQPSCGYTLTDDTGTLVHNVVVPAGTREGITACITDILALVEEVGCTP